MNYGLYLSASGVLTNSYRQDVFANNLANVNTVGFKPDLPTLRQRQPQAVEDLAPFGSSNQLLERLGGGVLAGKQQISLAAGPIESTGRPLDAALTDPNSFFTVRVTDPATGQNATRLTRDGRFNIDSAGQLVTPSGHPVLNRQNQPITVAPGATITLTASGGLQQDGLQTHELQVSQVTDPDMLRKAGGNLLAFVGEGEPGTAPQTEMRIGHLESSATKAIPTLMQVTSAAKAATGNANMLKYHDTMMDGAINTLGRVA
jgi:flagellar basal body rod protein FlgG